MRKLLKLVAIGALLAVGPIQAFATVDDTSSLSDELIVTIPAEITTATFAGTNDFKFYEGTEGNVTNPVFSPVVQGAFTLNEGRYALLLTEDGSNSNEIHFSDALGLRIVPVTGAPIHQNRYQLNFIFLDEPDGSAVLSFCQDNSVNCKFRPESDFNTLTSLGGLGFNTGLGNAGIDVMFASYVDVIPEPEIYAMMGIGLALIGFVARRKRELQDRAAT